MLDDLQHPRDPRRRRRRRRPWSAGEIEDRVGGARSVDRREDEYVEPDPPSAGVAAVLRHLVGATERLTVNSARAASVELNGRPGRLLRSGRRTPRHRRGEQDRQRVLSAHVQSSSYRQTGGAPGAAPGGASLTSRCCTPGGIVGASVIATRRSPRSHFIVHWPRSQFSTEIERGRSGCTAPPSRAGLRPPCGGDPWTDRETGSSRRSDRPACRPRHDQAGYLVARVDQRR